LCRLISSTFFGNPTPALDFPSFSDSYHSKVYSKNKKLYDYVCGTITTMFYDPTGGSRFIDDLEWRRSIRKVNPMIFYSDTATTNLLKETISSLGDKYSYYSPPSSSPKVTDQSQFIKYSPKIQQNTLLIPSLGVELQDQIFAAYRTGNAASLYLKSVPVITAVLAQSPAEKAGLHIGDQILAVDGYELEHIEKTFNSQFLNQLNLPDPNAHSKDDSHAQSRIFSRRSGESDGVLRLMKKLFTVSDVRSRYNTAMNMRLKVRQKHVEKTFYYQLNGNNEDDGIGSVSRMRDTTMVNLVPDFRYLDDNHRVIYRRIIEKSDKGSVYSSINGKNSNLQDRAVIDYIRIVSFDRRSSRELFQILKKSNLLVSTKSLPPYNRPKSNNPFVSNARQANGRDKENSVISESSNKRLVIVDLRNNYGGVIQDAMFSASLFLSDPAAFLCHTVSSRAPMGHHDVAEVVEDSSLRESFVVDPKVQVVLLANAGTASAAEVFTAALSENNRAMFIGTRTYGKSLIQHIFRLPNGGHLHLSVSQYLTPTRTHLSRDISLLSDEKTDFLIPVRPIRAFQDASRIGNVEENKPMNQQQYLRVRDLSLGGGLLPQRLCNQEPIDSELLRLDLCCIAAAEAHGMDLSPFSFSQTPSLSTSSSP